MRDLYDHAGDEYVPGGQERDTRMRLLDFVATVEDYVCSQSPIPTDCEGHLIAEAEDIDFFGQIAAEAILEEEGVV